MLPAFDLLQPATLTEALELLAARPTLTPIAGGTSLLVNLRDARESAEMLLDLGRLDELAGIEISASEIVIGAGTTIAELLSSPAIEQRAGVLFAACKTFAAPLVRNRATIGGNLADASPAADLAPPLLVLDAELELRSTEGKRLVPIREFFISVRRTVRREGELLTAVHVPLARAGERTAYRKLGLRKADAISVVSAAVRASFDGDGVCESVRIALGAVAPTPILARRAGESLRGRVWSREKLQEASRLAASETQPIDDVRGSAAYRKRTVETLVRRLLSEVGHGV